MESREKTQIIEAPEGSYVDVIVRDILESGLKILSDGTGTCSATGVFSCGTFHLNERPVLDAPRYKITAMFSESNEPYELAPMKCTSSGATSDFKSAQQ